jgi:MoxR-like ATPase
MAATLEITRGVDLGKRIQLEPGRWLIGRGEDCDIRLQDNSISRHHAVIAGDDGTWSVRDLGSQNGTWLNEQKVTDEVPMQAGGALRLGSVELTFACTPAAPEKTADAGAAAAPAPAPVRPEAHGAPADIAATLERIRGLSGFYRRIESEFGKVIVGQRGVLEELLIAIAANGHCLMVGLPGLAKTLMVSTLSRLLQLSFKRIQFTPDLMPADIIGSEVLEVHEASGQKSFRFVRGPIFTNMVLADEINRTPPKTQAALLESMQERQVTVANNVFPLPRPFFVLATQNPLEQEGTYPLPEAQLDRFLFNILVDYPSEPEEEEIVQMTTGSGSVSLDTVITAEELLAVQDAVRELPVSPHVIKYATRLVRASRPRDPGAPEFIREYVGCGAGPRAAQHLVLAAKAQAVIHGEVNVSCQNVRDLALPVLRHRLFTNFAADSENITPDELIRKLLKEVPEPGPADYPAGPRG